MSRAAIRKAANDEAWGDRLPRAGARLRRLMLADFRSWERLDLELDGRSVALSGPNGAGKTNLLEALSLFAPGRGLRHARLEELSRIGGDARWAVSARLLEGGDEIALGVGSGEEGGRLCRIDGSPATLGAFAERVRLIWLTPAQDRLFADGAAERRRFLDRMATAFNPGTARALTDYETALRQRQRLLDERRLDDLWLTALEREIAEAGVAVAAARRDAASALAAAAIEAEEALFPAADLAIQGTLEAMLAYQAAADVEDDFAARLKESRRLDAEAGRALCGPHRSDLIVTHRAKGREARHCSTGEQKALLIGLVLANARALALKPEAAPLVLLLDEIAAHLDPDRRSALFDILDGLGFQCFMTGTDAALFDAWRGRAQAFDVREGAVSEL